MNDRVLVEALRDRDPGALAALYDSRAESIYRFCWAMLGSADGAQVALRDTLIAAEARIASLADPEQLRAWLFALARGECTRRRMPGFVITDDTDPAGMAVPASGEADDDLRVTAWNATQALSVDDREVLELSTRHDLSGPDLAAALGRPVRQAESLREAATERLRDAVTAEVLAGKGPHDCPKRAKILEGHTGDLTTETREQLVRHIARCDTCKPHRDRQISTAKVFALLPSAILPDTLRVRVMSCFIDPELVPYRTYVARRVGTLDPNGFPIANETPARRWPLLALGTAAAIAAAAATVIAFTQLATTPGEQIIGTASGLFPSTAHHPTPKITKSPKPPNKPLDLREILEISQRIPIRPGNATHPILTKAPPSRPNPTPTSHQPTPKPTPPPPPTVTVTLHEPPPTQRPHRPRSHNPRPACPPKPPTQTPITQTTTKSPTTSAPTPTASTPFTTPPPPTPTDNPQTSTSTPTPTPDPTRDHTRKTNRSCR